MKYFELGADHEIAGRWHLTNLCDKTGTRFDCRALRYGLPVDVGPPLRLPLYTDGTVTEVAPPLTLSKRPAGAPLDVTFAGLGMLVVTKRVGEIFSALAAQEIQRLPVTVEGESEIYEIVNLISRFACIDRERSEIDWWSESDGRADKVGKPRTIAKLVIDPNLTGTSQIFRIEDWAITVVVSETVKQALESARVSGIRFAKEGDGRTLFDLYGQLDASSA